MIAAAMRVRAFRRANNMTQDEAATQFGVDTRSVRRWESGAPVPRWVQDIISSNDPLMARMVEGLVAIVRYSEGLMVLLDDELSIIENSPPHKQRMRDLFGIDIVGRSWLDFMTPEAKQVIVDEGGLEAIIARGFIHGEFPYQRTINTLQGERDVAGITYQASVWLGNGAHMGVLTITDLKPGQVLPDKARFFYTAT